MPRLPAPRRLLCIASAGLALAALGGTCTPPVEQAVAPRLPPDQPWVGPLGTRWLAVRIARGAELPVYPAAGLVAPVCLALDGTVVISPVADTFESGGYWPVAALVEPQLAELSPPPPLFRDLQRYAALGDLRLWLWAWQPGQAAVLSAANAGTAYALPENWRTVWVEGTSATQPADDETRPREPDRPVVSARLPPWPSWPPDDLAAAAERSVRAGREPAAFLCDDPLAGTPYIGLRPAAASPYLYPLRAWPADRSLPSQTVPLQDRVSLPDPVGRTVAFAAAAADGPIPGVRYAELFTIALAANVPPLGRANAVFAIGALNDPRRGTLLHSALRDREPQVARAAAYMIGLAGYGDAAPVLLEARTQRPELADVCTWALARLGSPELQRDLLARLPVAARGGPCPFTVHELLALGSLLSSGSAAPEQTSAAVAALTGWSFRAADPVVRRAAVLALTRIGQTAADDALARLLREDRIAVTELLAVVERLASAGTAGADWLVQALQARSATTRAAAGLALQATPATAEPALIGVLAADAPLELRRRAVAVLSRLPASDPAAAALRGVSPDLRPEAAAVLALWRQDVPASWGPAAQTLLPTDVSRRRLAPPASAPASQPAGR